jgi:hypothetical protein
MERSAVETDEAIDRAVIGDDVALLPDFDPGGATGDRSAGVVGNAAAAAQVDAICGAGGFDQTGIGNRDRHAAVVDDVDVTSDYAAGLVPRLK